MIVKYRKLVLILLCISALIFIGMIIFASVATPIGTNPKNPEEDIYSDFDSAVLGFLFVLFVVCLAIAINFYQKYKKMKIDMIIASEKYHIQEQPKPKYDYAERKQFYEDHQRLYTEKRTIKFNNLMDTISRVEIDYNEKSVHENFLVRDLDVNFKTLQTNTNIMQLLDFVVIDVETIGLTAALNTILQISAIRFVDFRPIEMFSTYINPKKSIPADITNINGITDDIVKDAPIFDWIIDSLDEFIGRSTIVGHNLEFDLKFLYKHGYNFKKYKRFYFDTYSISRAIDKNAYSRKLKHLCEDHSIIIPNAHNSEHDALATGLLFLNYVREKIDLDELLYPPIDY